MYSPGAFVPAAQYIIELICEKKAAQDKVDLPPKFWNLPHWNQYFRQQLRACHKLLKQHDEKAIIAALRNPKTKRTYSLSAPWLIPIIAEEQRLLAVKKAAPRQERTIVPSTQIILRTRPIKKNSISLLKELDNGEKEEREGRSGNQS